MGLYKLSYPADNPRYYGLTVAAQAKSIFGNDRLIDDFLPIGFPSCRGELVIPSLKDGWKSDFIQGRLRSFLDFSMLGFFIPVFSRRAVEALEDVLLQNGEILSTNSDHFIFNCTSVLDILDRKDCDMEFSSPIERFPYRINKYVPKSDSLPAIFRIVDEPKAIFVSDVFYKLCMDSELFGLMFTKLWPLSGDSSWHLAEADAIKNGMRINGRFVDAYTLTLTLNVSDDQLAINIIDSLDDFFFSKDTDPSGTCYLAAIDEVFEFEGEFSVNITCPDVVAAENGIREVMLKFPQSLNWCLSSKESEAYQDFEEPSDYSEEPINAEYLEWAKKNANQCTTLLDIDDGASTKEKIKRFERFCADAIASGQPKWLSQDKLQDVDQVDILGSFLGEIMVKDLGWCWVQLQSDQWSAREQLAVVTEDRRLMILPFQYVTEVLTGSSPLKASLALEILESSDDIPPISPFSYADVMKHIQYIVPPS